MWYGKYENDDVCDKPLLIVINKECGCEHKSKMFELKNELEKHFEKVLENE